MCSRAVECYLNHVQVSVPLKQFYSIQIAKALQYTTFITDWTQWHSAQVSESSAPSSTSSLSNKMYRNYVLLKIDNNLAIYITRYQER